MSRVVQEKFQINYPQEGNDDSHGGWKKDSSARVKKGTPSGIDARFNLLPPGMDIEDQKDRCIHSMSVNGNGSQVTNDLTAESLRAGFHRKKMLSTDDMYTREHNDAFYDVVKVDGQEGFVERNNYLDRV